MPDTGSGTVIDFGNGDILEIASVSASSLSASNLEFA